MVHSNTERLTDYWHARRPVSGPPPRAAIDPSDFADLLSQVFILGRTEQGQYQFRLVGGLIEDLHGRDMRQALFLPLWAEDQSQMRSALETARRLTHSLVVTASGQTPEGHELALEVFLAPLKGANGEVDRFLGLYQPTSPVALLRGRPLRRLSVGHIGLGGALNSDAPRLRLATVDGRLVG